MKRMQSRRRGARRGFTLLEVLMVVVIIGVLAVVVLTQLGGAQDAANLKLAKTFLTGKLAPALDRFKLDFGRYPTDEEGLAILYEKPSDEEMTQKWSGPYIAKEQLRDPWSNEYTYKRPGDYNPDTFDISSPGPDGVQGNDDDIGNWEKTN